jgi:hypothetical protein
MPDQNGFIPFDGEGALIPTNLWSLALAGLAVRHAVYLRGNNSQPPGKFDLASPLRCRNTIVIVHWMHFVTGGQLHTARLD